MKLRNTFAKMLLGGALVVSSQLLAIKPAQAALLANYNLNGNLNDSANASGVSTTNLMDGPGFKKPPATQAAHFSIRLNPNQTRAITFNSLLATDNASSIAMGDYYGFTLTPDAGQKVNFSSLKFDSDVGTKTRPGATGSFFVQASVNGGAFTNVSPTFTQLGTNGLNFTPRTANLGPVFSGGFFSTPVEFRIYQFDNANNTDGGLRVDDVQLFGQVSPVPELSTGLLVALSLGGMCFVGLRRKKGTSSSMTMAF